MNNNEQIIFHTVRGYGLPSNMVNLIVAQAKHETGNFSSAVFRDCRNLFGYSSINQSTDCPGHTFYKIYPDYEASVKELIAWIKRRQNEGRFPSDLSVISSPLQYAQLLKDSGYYTDSVANYAGGLSRWYVDFANDNPGMDKKKN